MFVLVSYDVATADAEGRRRLRRVAKTCLGYGQRVQHSVFECVVDPEKWARLKLRLMDEFSPHEDSLRFYYLGSNWKHRVEHHGVKPSIDLEGPLVI
jgi:CRISPR-associated protein Cas2